MLSIIVPVYDEQDSLETLHRQIPFIILTGDISTGTLRDIAGQDCVQLNKPVKLWELNQAIQRLLPVL